MTESDKILLVEGEADKQLFSVVCHLLRLDPTIKVAPPREVGARSNTKGSVFSVMPALLKQLPDGEITRLAVIVDADHPENHGMGYRRTLDQFSDLVGRAGYRRVNPKGLKGGIIFGHNDGLRDLGLWIMPDNRLDGVLEQWVKDCISDTESVLYGEVRLAIDRHAKPMKFSSFNRVKAEIFTWLAWQQIPGQGVHAACRAAYWTRRSLYLLALVIG